MVVNGLRWSQVSQLSDKNFGKYHIQKYFRKFREIRVIIKTVFTFLLRCHLKTYIKQKEK